ncbi:uncharacterized protein [Montipora capricornis]|uniref:uncharacterized protein isoform X1 n=1 Tax=Montipora capricornis TaxID=246305 RepID=UPI0035F17539
MVFLNRLIILIPHRGHEMSNMNSVDQKKKAIYLVSENVLGTLFKRGIACAVSFQNETFLLTSSSVIKEVNASEKPKQLIAERFSRKYFGDYQAEVSILTTIGKFTFLKIVQECKCHKREGWSIGPFIFNVDVPSSEMKASGMSPFCGRQKFKVVEFECNGNNMNIEVKTEIPIERTSIVGAPIFNEKKNTQKRKSQYPVNAVHIGVVGLNSEGRLCSYYLNKDVLDNLLSCKEKRGSVGTQTNKPVEQDTLSDSGKGQPTTSLDHPSVSVDGMNIKRSVEDTLSDSGKGQPTTSLDHPSVSVDGMNIKRSVEDTLSDSGKGQPTTSLDHPSVFVDGMNIKRSVEDTLSDSGKGQPTTSLDHPSVSVDGMNIKRSVEDTLSDSGKGQPTTSLDHPSVSVDGMNIKRSVEDTLSDSGKGQPTTSLDHPSVSVDGMNIKLSVEDTVPDSGKGQPTTSLDHPSVSGDASNIKLPVEDTVPDSGKGQPTTSLDHPSVSGDASNIKLPVQDTVPDSEKGQPTTSLDHPSVSGDGTNIKRSVEETCVQEPAISYNRSRQFERGEPAEFAARNFTNKLPPLTQRFTGREKVVEEIVSKLTQPKPFRMVVLLSIPGAGKTQAAIKVGHDLLKYNKSLIFIEKQETLEQLCTEIIRGISGWYISGSNDLVRIAKEKLKAVGSDVCIILDNTEDIQEKEREEFDSFVNFVVQEAPAIQLIITSQEDVGCTSLNVHKEFLPPLDPQSCALLLQGSVPITEEKAQEIGTLCGGIPLLLVPCVALLQKSFSPEALIQWLKGDPIQFLRVKAENVYNALGKFLRKMPNSLLENLIKLSVFPASFSVKDISEIHFNDELESETVKTTMVGCSLLERMGDGKYALHPLVREYCRANRKDLGMDEVGKSAQDKFNEHFIEKLRTLSKEFITKDSAMGAISSFREYRANIMEALRNYMYLDENSSTDERAFGVDVAISTEVLDFLCKVLLPPAECLKFYRRCCGIAKGLGDQRRLANSLNALGFRYLCDVAHLKPNQQSLDKFKEAKGIYEKLSKEQQNCQAHAHILSKLGLCLCLQGEEKEGRKLIHEGIALKEKLGDPLYLAAGYCDLGNAYCTLGDHQKAIDIWEEETLPIYRNQLGEHPWTATILHFIALSYKALAKTNVDGAVENSRNSLKLRKKLLGFHQDTARSHVLLSDVLVEVQNDFKSGLKELEQALEIQKEVLGENHSSTTDTKMRIANVRMKGCVDKRLREEKNKERELSWLKEGLRKEVRKRGEKHC